jgi:hypothetical protein
VAQAQGANVKTVDGDATRLRLNHPVHRQTHKQTQRCDLHAYTEVCIAR